MGLQRLGVLFCIILSSADSIFQSHVSGIFCHTQLQQVICRPQLRESDCTGDRIKSSTGMSFATGKYWEEVRSLVKLPEVVGVAGFAVFLRNVLANINPRCVRFFTNHNIFSNSFSSLSESMKPTSVIDSKMSTEVRDLVSLSSKYIELTEKSGWEFVGESENIRVWRCKTPLSSSNEAGKWPCIKTTAVVDASAVFLSNLFMDSSKIHLTSKYSMGRTDIEHVDADTKVVWNRFKIPFAMKPNDFSLLLHSRQLQNRNEFMVVSKSIDHPLIPVRQEFFRSETFLAMSLLKPLKNDPSKTEITTINHIKIGGVHPMLASRNFYHSSVGYFKQLNSVLREVKMSR